VLVATAGSMVQVKYKDAVFPLLFKRKYGDDDDDNDNDVGDVSCEM
jgi:hypothetical protein